MVDCYKQALDHVEEVLRRTPNGSFQITASPNILCSKLPSHWRSNKSLLHQFCVVILYPVVDGTKVTVMAGNEENPIADIKNNETEVQGQIARFSDLRFVGKSGRGKNFNLTITIHSKSMKEVAIVNGVIKVTVDGPRESRNSNKQMMGDSRKRSSDAFNFIPSFLPLKQPRIFPPGMFPILPASIAPPLLQATTMPPSNPVYSLPAIYESYKAMMGTTNPNQRMPNYMPTDPVFLQHLINLIGQKGPNNREPKSQTKSPNLKSESPKLPSSTDLPSPCFNNKETNLKPNSSTETLLHSFSSSNSSNFLREDEVQIDVETTTDDDEQTAEQHGAGNENKLEKEVQPVAIKIWRPYSPSTSVE